MMRYKPNFQVRAALCVKVFLGDENNTYYSK